MTLIRASLFFFGLSIIGVIFFGALYIEKKLDWALNALFLTILGAAMLVLTTTIIYYLYIMVIALDKKCLVRLPYLKQIKNNEYKIYNLITTIHFPQGHTLNQGTVQYTTSFDEASLYKAYNLADYYIFVSNIKQI